MPFQLSSTLRVFLILFLFKRLVEEATNGNPGAPDTRTLKLISRAAFEVDDYWRIVEILHKRFLGLFSL